VKKTDRKRAVLFAAGVRTKDLPSSRALIWRYKKKDRRKNTPVRIFPGSILPAFIRAHAVKKLSVRLRIRSAVCLVFMNISCSNGIFYDTILLPTTSVCENK
jgi:hypothetical protein